MSLGLRHSTIEQFRKRYHPNQQLRLLKLADDGQIFIQQVIVEAGFYINRNTDVSEGAAEFLWCLDTNLTADLDWSVLKLTHSVDLFNPINPDNFQRYKKDIEAQPMIEDFRYIFGLYADFSDTRTVVTSVRP